MSVTAAAMSGFVILLLTAPGTEYLTSTMKGLFQMKLKETH